MGTTANLGIVYPDPSGVPSRLNWVENPIKSVDAQVAAYLKARYRSGVTTITTNSSGAAVQTVTIPGGAMAGAPNVTVSFSTTPGGVPLAANSQIRADVFTSTSFRVVIGGANASAALGVAWTAIVN